LRRQPAGRGAALSGDRGPSGAPPSAIVKRACASWTLAAFEFYGSLWQEDGAWGTSTIRRRAIARLELLAETTAELGHFGPLGATAGRLARRLGHMWPEVEPMALYPAFRGPGVTR